MEVGEKELCIGGSGWDGLGENHRGVCQAGAQRPRGRGTSTRLASLQQWKTVVGHQGFLTWSDLTKSEP